MWEKKFKNRKNPNAKLNTASSEKYKPVRGKSGRLVILLYDKQII